MRKPFKKTGIPLSEMTRNVGEKPQQKKPIWIPAEQAAVHSVLIQILNELKEIKEELKRKP